MTERSESFGIGSGLHPYVDEDRDQLIDHLAEHHRTEPSDYGVRYMASLHGSMHGPSSGETHEHYVAPAAPPRVPSGAVASGGTVDVFHATPHFNEDSIRRRGLRPGTGDFTVGTRNDAHEFAQNMGGPYSLLHLKIPADVADDYLGPASGGVHALRQTVPPAFIHAVTRHPGSTPQG